MVDKKLELQSFADREYKGRPKDMVKWINRYMSMNSGNLESIGFPTQYIREIDNDNKISFQDCYEFVNITLNHKGKTSFLCNSSHRRGEEILSDLLVALNKQHNAVVSGGVLKVKDDIIRALNDEVIMSWS